MSDISAVSRLPARLLGLAAAGTVALAAGCSASQHVGREPAGDAAAPAPGQSPQAASETPHEARATSGDPPPGFGPTTRARRTPAAAVPEKDAAAPVDYATKLAELVAAHQRAGEEAPNRWDQYVSVVERVSGAWSYFEASNEAVRRFEAADPEDLTRVLPRQILEDPTAQHLLPELRSFLATLDEMKLPAEVDALTDNCRFVAPRPVGMLLSDADPELSTTRSFVRLWNARMRLALDDHDPDRFKQSLRQSLAMERAPTGGYTLMHGYVASILRMLTAEELVNALMDGVLTGDNAAIALRCLNDDPPAADLKVMFDCHRYLTLDTIDRFFTNIKKEANVPAEHAGLVDDGLGLLASHDQQVDFANRLHDAIVTFVDANATPQARQAAADEFGKLQAFLDDRDQFATYQPVGQFLPEVAGARAQNLQALAMDAGVRTMLALEAFRTRTGRYPEQLAELVPADIDQLPIDPYTNAGSFHYRRLLADGGGPADGYVLYTVGLDGEDNGGRTYSKLPIEAISRGTTGRGFDYIFNQREP